MDGGNRAVWDGALVQPGARQGGQEQLGIQVLVVMPWAVYHYSMDFDWGFQSAVVAVSVGEWLGRCRGAVVVDVVIEMHGSVEKESNS
jgi:hypothetical protein